MNSVIARIGAWWLVAAALMASVAAAGAAEEMGVDDARHLLARAGFGGTPAEIARFARLTRTEAIDTVLAPTASRAQTPPPAWVSEPLEGPRALREATPEQRQAFVREQARRAVELRGWWLGEMIATPAPLTERMTLFWHNHFVSSQQKVRRVLYLYRQNALFRDYALGNFGTLLHAVAKDPAMVIYLDAAGSRKDRPNENFAREVMELFTLGEGHYGEGDIREAARAFTGWSIDLDSGEFIFRRIAHDDGAKTVLGLTGAFDGDAVLDILLAQPATAEFIVAKLWREFVSLDTQSDEVRGEIKRVAARFRTDHYAVRTALRELFLSRSFWAAKNRGGLIKSPVDLVVGTVRQFEIEVPDATPLALIAGQLGQSLFAPPNVRGWPGGEHWVNASSLLARKQFLERVFRAAEAPRLSPSEMSNMRGPMRGSGQLDRAQLARSMDQIRFDPKRWLNDAGAVAGATPAQLVLATAPVNTNGGEIAATVSPRLLVLDPAYQVK